MRILFISNAIDKYRGGHTRNILLLAEALRSRGHKTDFFVQFAPPDMILQGDASIHYAGLSRYTIPRFSQAAVRFVKSHSGDYDIVHLNGGAAYGICLIPKLDRPPVALHLRAANYRNAYSILHDDLFYRNVAHFRHYLGTLYEWHYDKIAIAAADHIFCNSRDTLNNVRMASAFSGNMSVLHNGYDASLNAKPRPSVQYRVGYLARYTLQKGWKYFFDISEAIAQAYPSATFHLAGWGPLEGYINSRINSHPARDRFRLYGKVSSEDEKRCFFDEIDVFLCPTAPGTTTLEAISYGVRVIVAKRSKDLTDGLDLWPFLESGWGKLMLNYSAQAVAEEIHEFHRSLNINPTLSSQLNEIYQWKAIAEQCENTYSTLMQ